MRALAAVLAIALSAGPAAAADPAAAAARLQAAVTALAEAQAARDRVAALTEAIAAYEEGLAALREALRSAALREAAIARRLEAESQRVSRLLGVLTALERAEGPLLLLHPAGPLGTVRSGLVLAEVTPALQAEVAALRADLEELAAIRGLRATAAAVLEEGLSRVQAARAALGQAMADRRDLPPRLTEDVAAVAALAAAVDTLDAFAAELRARPAPGPEGPAGTGLPPVPFAEARGRLPWPVQGRLIRAAGEADAAGIRRPGVLLAARPAALVTAPWAATVRYVGPLADYANVMVLEPEEPYLLVLAGLDLVYAAAGEIVEAGAALGLMGGREAMASEFVASARQGGLEASETLYVEVREAGVAVDPSAWFTAPAE